MLNQPRARAKPLADWVETPAFMLAVMSISLRVQDDFDAAVFLVAEPLVHLRAAFEAAFMGYDEGGIDLSLFDPPKQVVGPTVHMRLPRADGQALVHHHP